MQESAHHEFTRTASAPGQPSKLRQRFQGSLIMAVSLGALAAPLAATPCAAHEDDPKILDRRPAFPGSGYRRSLATTERATPNGGLGFTAQGIRLDSWLTLADLGNDSGTGNDCWGYVAPSGREYALIGTSSATVIVEITDPGNAQVIERIDGPSSLWRDIKVYQDRAYSVSEGGDGIQVINLASVDAGTVTLENTITGQGSDSTHNVAIDVDSGFLYRTGGSGNGLRVYSLANPASPQYVGSWNSRYVHDAQVVTYTSGPYAGRQIAFCCSGFNNGHTDTGLTILDVTNKSNMQVISQVSYPNRRYSHQGWLSADRTRFYLGDELDERVGVNLTTTRVFDVTNLNNASYLGVFDNGMPSISHNMYERDGFLFQANYTSGLRIHDLRTSPDNPPEVASFDTAPNLTTSSFNGLWSCYPDFPSGTIIGSDLERGLFVFTFAPLSVDVTSTQLATVASTGETITAQIGELITGTLNAASIKLVADLGQGPMDVPMTATGVAGEYTADLPPAPCGAEVSWYVSAESMDGVQATYPATAPVSPFVSLVGTNITVARSDDMQSAAGWVGGAPGDTALRGHWTREAPIGTDAEPHSDHTPGTRLCWFTGQGQVANNTDADVDFGYTTLTTPVIDMSQLAYPTVEYHRWFSNQYGVNPQDDVFLVEISNDAGASWTTLESVGPMGHGTEGGWVRASMLVPEIIAPTANMQLRFIASDTGMWNIVEAAIDDFRVIDATCSDPVGAAYCTAEPNSSGGAGTITGTGSAFLALNDLELVATGLPMSQTGFFVVSRDQAFVPNAGGGQGTLCVGAGTGRYLGQVANSGAAGEIRLIVDAGAIPQPINTVPVMPGETWNFQCWHRDANPGPTSNMTQGYSVTFR